MKVIIIFRILLSIHLLIVSTLIIKISGPFGDMPPLFDPTNLTGCVGEACQLVDDIMKNFDKPPPPGEVGPILQRLRRYRSSGLLINSSALKVLMQRLTEHVE